MKKPPKLDIFLKLLRETARPFGPYLDLNEDRPWSSFLQSFETYQRGDKRKVTIKEIEECLVQVLRQPASREKSWVLEDGENELIASINEIVMKANEAAAKRKGLPDEFIAVITLALRWIPSVLERHFSVSEDQGLHRLSNFLIVAVACYVLATSLCFFANPFQVMNSSGKTGDLGSDTIISLYNYRAFFNAKVRICSTCSEPAPHKCGKCDGLERYCSLECQKLRWKHHKYLCGKYSDEQMRCKFLREKPWRGATAFVEAHPELFSNKV